MDPIRIFEREFTLPMLTDPELVAMDRQILEKATRLATLADASPVHGLRPDGSHVYRRTRSYGAADRHERHALMGEVLEDRVALMALVHARQMTQQCFFAEVLGTMHA